MYVSYKGREYAAAILSHLATHPDNKKAKQ